MRDVCTQQKRTFRILRALPFFQALCDRNSIRGTVLFDPSGESDMLLRHWIMYRDPTLKPWVKRAPRDRLIREAVRDMILHGSSPALGMFLDFDPQRVSIAFLSAWLGWFGIIPSPDLDLAARSEAWWRDMAVIRLAETRKSPLIQADQVRVGIRDTSMLLVRTLTTARVTRDRMVESMEVLDDCVVNSLSTRDFNIFLHVLAKERFPEDTMDMLSGETDQERDSGDVLWQVFRHTRALAARTGTGMLEVRHYVSMKHNAIKRERARVAADPGSSNASNSSFWIKHGLDITVRSLSGTGAMSTLLLQGAAIQIFGTSLKSKTGWENSNAIIRTTIDLIRALASKSRPQAVQAAGHLMSSLWSMKSKVSLSDTQKTILDSFINGFLKDIFTPT